jgi:hypothetical protein
MPEEEIPPVRKLVLKPREVTPTDSVSRLGDGTEISVRLMHKQNELAAEKAAIRRATHPPMPVPEMNVPPAEPSVFAPKEIVPTDPPSLPGDGTAVSANLILKENRLTADKHAPEIIAMPPKRRSRRTRDFIVLVALVNLGVLGLVLLLPRTIGSLILGFFLVVFVTVTLAWIMFGVMDEY